MARANALYLISSTAISFSMIRPLTVFLVGMPASRSAQRRRPSSTSAMSPRSHMWDVRCLMALMDLPNLWASPDVVQHRLGLRRMRVRIFSAIAGLLPRWGARLGRFSPIALIAVVLSVGGLPISFERARTLLGISVRVVFIGLAGCGRV